MNSGVRFGTFSFDYASSELRKAGHLVHLQAQPAQVLGLLLSRAGEVVSREEIRAHVWRDRWAEFDQGINTCISQVRNALGDNAASPLYIETVPRAGYRFIAEIRAIEATPPRPPRRFRPLAGAAAAGLGLALLLAWRGASGPARPPVAAREAQLRGEYLLQKKDPESAAQALTQFERAIEVDSGFAEAWVGLARARLAREADPRKVKDAARDAVNRALRLDPDLAAARAELARILFWYEWDWDGAEREFERALRLKESEAATHHDYALLLAARGRADDALRHVQRARALDPASPAIATDIGVVYYLMRRYEDAGRAARTALEVEPAHRPATTLLYTIALRQGRDAEAMEYARQFIPARLLPADVAEGRLNDARATRAVAEAVLRWVAGAPGGAPESSMLRAQQYLILGQRDSALVWLDRAWTERERWLVFASVEPGLDPIRDDPRFTGIISRMGL